MDDLERLTVVKVREEAYDKGIESASGKKTSQLIKELSGVLRIEKPREDLGDQAVQTKSTLKQQIHARKAQRAPLIETHDHKRSERSESESAYSEAPDQKEAPGSPSEEASVA